MHTLRVGSRETDCASAKDPLIKLTLLPAGCSSARRGADDGIMGSIDN